MGGLRDKDLLSTKHYLHSDMLWNILRATVAENRARRVRYLVHHYCLAFYCYDFWENIGFVYPAMSMIVIGLSLLYVL
jgi:hypothetical protein